VKERARAIRIVRQGRDDAERSRSLPPVVAACDRRGVADDFAEAPLTRGANLDRSLACF